MSTGTLIINGHQYRPTLEQSLLIEQAAKVRDAEFERIEREDSGPHNSLDNASDPYRDPILRYQARVCKIIGVV